MIQGLEPSLRGLRRAWFLVAIGAALPASGCQPEATRMGLAQLDLTAMELGFAAGADFGEAHRFVLRWAPGSPCPTVDGVSVTLDGVPFGEPRTIGWTTAGHAGEVCMSTEDWSMPVGALPRRSRDLTLVVSDGRTDLTFVLRDLHRVRHLVPEATLGTLRPGQRLLFVGPPAPPAGRPAPTVRLAPVDGGERGAPVEVAATGAGDDVVAVLPEDVAPGAYTLAVSALSEVRAECPAPQCTARLISRFVKRVTVEAP